MASNRRSVQVKNFGVGERAKALVALFKTDPLPVLEELREESPFVRLKFVMSMRRVSNRQLAFSVGLNESYFSTCVSRGEGLSRSWQAFADYFGLPKQWLVTGQCDKSKVVLADLIKNEKTIGGSEFQIAAEPPQRGAPTWARNLERMAIPIKLGEDAFGFQAGTMLWTEKATPQMGDRVIVEKKNGELSAWIMFLYDHGPEKGLPAIGHSVIPPITRWQDADNLRKAKKLKVEDVKSFYVVVGIRDRPLKLRTVAEVISIGTTQGEIMGENVD